MFRVFCIIVSFVSRGLNKASRVSGNFIAMSKGLQVGYDTKLVGTQSFGSEPFLIEIGDGCLITDGVKFITHDGAIQVPLIASGESIENVYAKKSTFDRIKVGNNVFIGVNSVLLPGTEIGNNSIVAAGSIVKGVFSEGLVIGGNPAKVITNIDKYADKNSNRILSLSSIEERRSQIESHLSR